MGQPIFLEVGTGSDCNDGEHFFPLTALRLACARSLAAPMPQHFPWRPLTQALQQPATSALAVACVGIWYLLHRWGLGYPEVGMSYEAVVQRRELWRAVTSQLSHVELLHLLFNVSALWTIGLVERAPALGTLYYLQHSALLFLLSPLVRAEGRRGCGVGCVWVGGGGERPWKWGAPGPPERGCFLSAPGGRRLALCRLLAHCSNAAHAACSAAWGPRSTGLTLLRPRPSSSAAPNTVQPRLPLHSCRSAWRSTMPPSTWPSGRTTAPPPPWATPASSLDG